MPKLSLIRKKNLHKQGKRGKNMGEKDLMKYLSRSPLTASGDECAIRALFCILILYILAHSFFAHVPNGTHVIAV